MFIRSRFYAKCKPVLNINLSLYLLCYAEACNELVGPNFASLHLQATQLLLKKCHSSGEPLATL